ncbi:hypothetical protein LZ31DRAFT_562395 [Colletotrichum somersetense]|nr:hypothetical protein LZ31DRAFT_562395 [Colletotrichum somersetense]
MDMMDCPNRGGGKGNTGQMPMGDGIGWDVPHISGNGTMFIPGMFPFDAFFSILDKMWELPHETTTTTTMAQTTPTAKPVKRLDARQNKFKCYNQVIKMDNDRLRYGIESFCYNLGSEAGVRGRDLQGRSNGVLKGGFKRDTVKTLQQPQERIDFSSEVLEGCEWTFDFDECTHYFKNTCR